MVAWRQPRTFTPEEYLELERKSEYRSEYLDGQIYAMSGGTPRHSLITTNISGEIRSRLKGTSWRTYGTDLKVSTPGELYTYLDVTVVCGEMRYRDDKKDICTNPILLVEVLSPSTEAYDRGAKWVQYQAIDTLQTYVMVSQQTPRVEQYVRQPNGDWMLSAVTGLHGSIHLASIECTLVLRDIYDGVEFPALSSF